MHQCCSCCAAVVRYVWLVASEIMLQKYATEKLCAVPVAVGSRHSKVNLLVGTAEQCDSASELFCSPGLLFCCLISFHAWFSLMLGLAALFIVAYLYPPWLTLSFRSLAL